MDYKKKYKEAFKRAKGMHEQGMMPERLEYVFPELKESEDERIRKDIIVLVKDWWDRVNKDNISAKEQMIAYLEKQGEQKPNYCHHEVDLSNCSEEYTKGYYDGWNNCNQQHAQLEAEQKPAWSEEDEEK